MLTNKYSIEVNKAWCKGCSLCICVCPKKVIELNSRHKCVPMRQHNCIGCRQCEYICPDLAITIKEASN